MNNRQLLALIAGQLQAAYIASGHGDGIHPDLLRDQATEIMEAVGLELEPIEEPVPPGTPDPRD